jgi:hypothetical protein
MSNTFALLSGPEFTQRTLVVSTCHYPPKTERAFFDDEDEPIHSVISVDSLECGWMIYISDDTAYEEELEKEHPELSALIKLARENGFSHLRFNCDALKLPECLGFPVFDWEAEEQV